MFARVVGDVIIAVIAGDHKDRPYNAMISMRIMESAVRYDDFDLAASVVVVRLAFFWGTK